LIYSQESRNRFPADGSFTSWIDEPLDATPEGSKPNLGASFASMRESTLPRRRRGERTVKRPPPRSFAFFA
jgi:hypothetical protein